MGPHVLSRLPGGIYDFINVLASSKDGKNHHSVDHTVNQGCTSPATFFQLDGHAKPWCGFDARMQRNVHIYMVL